MPSSSRKRTSNKLPAHYTRSREHRARGGAFGGSAIDSRTLQLADDVL